MKKAMTLSYETGGNLYLNITNRCPCSCTFCIRRNGDGAYGSDPLWLERQPGFSDMKADLSGRNLAEYNELVFCGYGEPTCELELLKETAAYIKSVCKTPVRLNTNGLSDVINGRSTAREFKGLIDTVSISLNAPDKETYYSVTRPSAEFGQTDCFKAMLEFAGEVAKYVPQVQFTVVDVIGQNNIRASQELARKIGIGLRIRKYEE